MEGLTGGAYFFAFLGFLLMVVVGLLFIPRASFAITIAILAHKLGYAQLFAPTGLVNQLSTLAALILMVVGLLIDAFAIIKVATTKCTKGHSAPLI